MRYPGGDDRVLSGLMRGANEIRNRAGDRRSTVGQGTRSSCSPATRCYRWQNFGEFNMLFNTVSELQRHQDRAGNSRNRDLSGGTLATRREMLVTTSPAFTSRDIRHTS